MRALFVLSLLCVYLQSTHATAQNQFDAVQSKIIRSASEQWLCRELNDVNKAYFNCNTKGWVLPEVGAFPLFNDTVQMDEEHIKRFQEIWFPKGDCKHFLAAVAMADVYMPLFKRKAQQFELPEDVAYLPVVLSGCDQHFLSGDKAGLWALNYLAARRQHLRIDTLVDERLGGDFTTDAALRHFAYLKQLQKEDTWRATVAYCDGASHVSQLDSIERGPSIMQLMDTNVSDRLLFLAYTVSLFRSVHLENQLSVCFDILGHYQPIIIEKPIQLKAIAAVLSIDEGRLRSTNPVYTGHYLMPGYRRVPFVLEDTLIGRFQIMKDSIARWQPVKPKVETEQWETVWTQHRVGKGETLNRIAARYHVTVSQIKKWNKLRNDRIRKGQVLKIEQRRKRVIENVTEPKLIDETLDSVADTTAIQQAPSGVAQPPLQEVSKGNAKTNASKAQKNTYYIVKSGDSLWSIARKYPGVTEQDLMKWNRCNANIRPGQKLLIKKK